MSHRRGVTRRGFLTVAVSAIVAGVVAGVGAYYAGTLSAPVKEVTKTVTSTTTLAAGAPYTSTVTVTQPPITVTKTETVTVTGTPKGVIPQSIKFGVPLNLVGSEAANGVRAKVAFDMLAEKINGEGGVYVKEYGKRLPIELIVVDGESDVSRFVELANKLILDYKVNLMLDCIHTPPFNLPVGALCEKNKLPAIIGSPNEVALDFAKSLPSGKFEYCWSMFFSIAGLVGAILDLTNKYRNETSGVVGLLFSEDPDGRTWYNIMGPAFESAGYKVVFPGFFPPGAKDFSGYIAKLKESHADYLYTVCSPSDFLTFWQQAKMLGYKPKMVAGGRYIDMLYHLQMIGESAVGLITQQFWSWDWPFPMNDWIRETWPKKTDLEVSFIAGFAVSQLLVAVDVVERAGTFDPEAINRALAETDMMTPVGRVKFNENHIATTPVTISQAKLIEGKWVFDTIWAPPGFGIPTKPVIFPLP